MPDLTLSAHIGIPGSLTIDIQAIANAASVRPPVLYPPLRVPVLFGKQEPISQAWGVNWATPMTNRLNALGGSLSAQLLALECPSLDTTDMGWFGTGAVDADSDPVTVSMALTGMSLYGRTFQPGDLGLWDDPGSINGLYQYEIDLITAVNGNVLTMARSQPNQSPGKAYFGTTRAAHAGKKFYRLLNPTFYQLWDGSEQTFKILWDQMIVAAISASMPDGSRGLSNLIPIPPAAASPGLAT